MESVCLALRYFTCRYLECAMSCLEVPRFRYLERIPCACRLAATLCRIRQDYSGLSVLCNPRRTTFRAFINSVPHSSA